MILVSIHLTSVLTWIRYFAAICNSICAETLLTTGAVDNAVKLAAGIAPSVLRQAWGSVCCGH